MKRIVRMSAVLAVLLFARAEHAKAGPIQFATFSETTANQPFTFTNNGGTSGTIGTSTSVTFNFTAVSGLSTADHAATLTITNSPPFPPGTPSTFTSASPSGIILDQPISNLTTLSLTEKGTGKNLLTLLFTGDILGSSGSANASLVGKDTTGQVVAFSSDFLTFSQPGNSYNLGLSNLNPGLSVGPGNFLDTFVADLGGQFSANVTPVTAAPEPASLTLLSLGFAGLALRAWRRRFAA